MATLASLVAQKVVIMTNWCSTSNNNVCATDLNSKVNIKAPHYSYLTTTVKLRITGPLWRDSTDDIRTPLHFSFKWLISVRNIQEIVLLTSCLVLISKYCWYRFECKKIQLYYIYVYCIKQMKQRRLHFLFHVGDQVNCHPKSNYAHSHPTLFA